MWQTGLFLMVIAGGLFWQVERIVHSQALRPLQAPLALGVKNATVTQTFTADTAATFYVQIDCQRRLPFGQFRTALNTLPTIVVWSVRSNGRPVPPYHYKGQDWGDTVGAIIGSFQAVPGQQYTVTATVKKPAPQFQVLRPQVQVGVSPPDYKPYVIGGQLAGIGAVIAVVAGLLFLLMAATMSSRTPAPSRRADLP